MVNVSESTDDPAAELSRAARLSRRKRFVFAAVPSCLLAVLLLCGWWVFFPKRGSALSRDAWERTYTDRQVAIPARGPRDGGFRGERIFPKATHAATVWCEPSVLVPDILEIDSEGRQYYRPTQAPTNQILILGGSVASGTYASTTANTYFAQLGSRLSAANRPTSITVFAAGAWKSTQDLAALEHSLRSGMKPDLAILINGLNDLTNGGTAHALFGEPTATKDGSRWTRLYHGHDYSQRIAVYLQNMQQAAKLAQDQQFPILFVLQPALFERQPLTRVEGQLLWASLAPHSSQDELVRSYARMRSGLQALADDRQVYVVDASTIFHGEKATTFTDMWHFSDFGHEILAAAIAPTVLKILSSHTPPATESD